MTVALAIAIFLAASRLRAAFAAGLGAIAGAGPGLRPVGFRHPAARDGGDAPLQPGRLDVYMTATFVLLALLLLVTPALTGEWPNAPVFPR